ncbi:MAG: VOC family protein [Candidatus Humimicrobiaceae bacterium]
MEIKGLGHIGINAGDFKKSLAFYQDILGCKKINLTNWSDNQMTTLQLPDGGLIELFDYGLRTERAESDNSVVGYRHIAFFVDNVDAWELYMIENGIEIKVSAVVMEQIGTKGMLCLDPDGTEIELYERLK